MSVTNKPEKKEKALRLAVRQGLLMIVDALERRDEISPRTSEIRNKLKKMVIEQSKKLDSLK
jgi:hypothetical protein